MGRIPQQKLDEIYNAADVLEIVGDYVTLKKKGQNYWALSPFVSEKTPSFAVNPNKGIYKCFSSGKGGNAVNFLMEMEGYAYVEALKHIARKYGIELEEEEETPESRDARDMRESVYIVNEFAARWFHEQLKGSDEGRQIGLSYFKERGILEATIEDFQLGYAPDAWEALAGAAADRQYKDEYLLELGLVSRSDKTGKLIDRFRGRVIFPIANPVGKIVGFGGRILGNKKDIAKYINSSESEIYHKSNVLYGLYQAKQHIRSADRCILTEGYMDTIVLHQNGIQNVVASSGTALTVEQIRLIRRFTKNVLMIYDGDAAGVKAAMRGIDLLIKDDMQVKVLILPDNHDPDSYVRKFGSAAFLEFIDAEALDFLSFKIRVMSEGQDKNDPQFQAELIKGLAETVGHIPDLVQRQMYIKNVAQRLDITEALMMHAVDEARRETHKSDVREKRREAALAPPEAEVKELKGFEQLELANQERELLRILVNHHDKQFVEEEMEGEAAETQEEIPLMEFFMVELEGLQFENQVYERLKAEMFEAFDEGRAFNLNQYLNHEDPAICRLVTDLMTLPEISPNWRKHDHQVLDMDERIGRTVKGAMYHYKFKKVSKMEQEVRQQLREAGSDETESDRLFELYRHLMALRIAIGKKFGSAGAIRGDDGRL